jgi:hypothetical protein
MTNPEAGSSKEPWHRGHTEGDQQPSYDPYDGYGTSYGSSRGGPPSYGAPPSLIYDDTTRSSIDTSIFHEFDEEPSSSRSPFGEPGLPPSLSRHLKNPPNPIPLSKATLPPSNDPQEQAALEYVQKEEAKLAARRRQVGEQALEQQALQKLRDQKEREHRENQRAVQRQRALQRQATRKRAEKEAEEGRGR